MKSHFPPEIIGPHKNLCTIVLFWHYKKSIKNNFLSGVLMCPSNRLIFTFQTLTFDIKTYKLKGPFRLQLAFRVTLYSYAG